MTPEPSIEPIPVPVVVVVVVLHEPVGTQIHVCPVGGVTMEVVLKLVAICGGSV